MAIARSYAARSVVVKPSLMTPLESCRPCGRGLVMGGIVAVWIVGRPKAAKLAANCSEVQRGRGGGCWATGVLLGTTTSLVIVVVMVCRTVTLLSCCQLVTIFSI